MGKIKNRKDKQAGKYVVVRKKTREEIQKDEKKAKEDKFYWARVITGVAAGIAGPLIGFVGLKMLLWLVCFWIGWPFVLSFVILRYPYEKGKWDWKMILKTGVGAFFFVFMVSSTLLHTLMFVPTLPSGIFG